MKPISTSLLLLAIAVFSFLPNRSTTAQAPNDHTFTIHVGTFVQAQLSDFNNIRQYGFLYAEKFQNNLLQVYMGEFPSEAAANALLGQVKTNGYPDAYVTRRNLQQGEKVHIIQLALSAVGEDIDWQSYLKAGPLYALLSGKQVKIVTGVFGNIEEANQRLSIVKKLGYADAFVKAVNNIYLHPISTFEAGGELVAPEVEFVVEAPETAQPIAEEPTEKEEPKTIEDEPVAEEAVVETPAEEPTPPAAEPIPESYDEVMTARSPLLADPLSTPLPGIRKNVKRTSAIELQKVLKKEGTYTGSLDGYYGKGTQGGYEKIMANNRQIRKYQTLAQHSDQLVAKAAPSALQAAISGLAENPNRFLKHLENSQAALAKAYQAYYYFATRGASPQVDDWMNTAIKTAFKGQKSTTPFDHKATYAYKDLDQLLLHLAYIHSVSGKEAAVPCWLFQRHPEKANEAFGNIGTYAMESCEQFTQWAPLRLLTTIAADLDPNPAVSQSLLAPYASIRSGLFVAPVVLTREEQKAIEAWNTSLWKGLDEWAAADPVHQKWCTPLKVAYYQSMVLLEDHYMDRDFKPLEAKGLALSVMQTVVAPYLDGYRK